MSDIGIWRAWLACQAHTLKSRRRQERGEITQTVIIVSLMAAAAIAICGIIIAKFTGKAADIPTG